MAGLAAVVVHAVPLQQQPVPVGTAEVADLAAATVQQRRRHECTRTCSHSSSTDNGGNAIAVVARARASHRGRGACSRMVVEATPRADLLGVVGWQVVGRATVEMWE